MNDRSVTIDVDEIVVHGVELANPGAFGDAVERRLAQLLRERGLPAAPVGRDDLAPGPVRMATRHDIAVEQRLDQLRHELAEVRVEPVDVLRALALGQVGLGPRECVVEAAVQGLLRRGHATTFAVRPLPPRDGRAPSPGSERASRSRQ